MSLETADVAIIGAGVIGLAVANELSKSGLKKITVLERESLPGMGSTSACTGGIRLQFSSAANIKFSLFGLERFAAFDEEFGTNICLRRNGYLFLIDRQDQLPRFSRGHQLQESLGVASGFVEPEWIRKIAPFLELDDIVAGSFCASEAHADPHGVVEGYLRRLRNYGIEVQTRRQVIGFEPAGNRVGTVLTTRGPISAGTVINCAGPFAGQVARMAGVELPLVARKRHVLAIKPASRMQDCLPLIVDSGSGWYLKSEPGGIALMGGTDRDGESSFNTSVDPEVANSIVESGVARAPALAESGIIRTIVGLRCMSPDDHALIGKIAHREGFYCAVGFSGHGFMHAPAAAVALTNAIIKGHPDLEEAAAFDPMRFSSGKISDSPEEYVF